jgi:hypothetical protein
MPKMQVIEHEKPEKCNEYIIYPNTDGQPSIKKRKKSPGQGEYIAQVHQSK